MSRSESAPTSVPRYERGTGPSARYWQILRRGATLTTWFGRAGQAPRAISRTFTDGAGAKRAYRALVVSKRAAGYVLTRPAAPVSASLPGITARNAALEAAIEADLEDVQSYLVYADWLQARGDPRGELIAVQYALCQDPESLVLKKVEESLLAIYGAELLGPLSDARADVAWHLGFVRAAHVKRTHETPDLADRVKEFLAHPAARFLREISLGDAPSYADVCKVLTAAKPKHLRALHVAHGSPVLGDLSGLLGALPDLQRLVLSGSKLRLGSLASHGLRELTLMNVDLGRETLRSLTGVRWAKLERLGYRRSWYGGGYVDRILERLGSDTVPRLRAISVSASHLRYGEHAVEPILRMRILPQLREIDLNLPLTDVDAKMLVDASASLSHLSRIRLREGNDIAQFLRKELGRRLPGKGSGVIEWSAFGAAPPRDWATNDPRLDPRGFSE